jgi:hypothetical protein
MSAQTIAWACIAGAVAVTVALEALRRYIARRNDPLTASEWLELMRKLDTVKKMASRIEGKPGVARAPKRKRERLALVKPIRKTGTK